MRGEGDPEGNGKRVVVVGAGLVGTCTAHYLWRAGYDVVVVDEGSSPAESTSFANAGRFCPTRVMTYPQASPGMLRNLVGLPFRKLVSWIESPDPCKSSAEYRELTATEDVPSSVSLNLPLISWGLWFGRNCTGAKWRHNNEVLRRLTHMSGAATAELLTRFSGGPASIDYSADNLWVYGSIDQRAGAIKLAQAASLSGYSNWEVLDCADCSRRYPSMEGFLARAAKAPGFEPSCIVAHDDYSVDARKYTLQVAALSSQGERPVHFKFGSRVSELEFSAPGVVRNVQVSSADNTTEVIPTDHVVVCTGPQARAFIRDNVGVDLQVQAMKGCSLDLSGVKNGPEVSMADYMSGSLNFQATPFGPKRDRLRLIGFADFEDLDGPKAGSNKGAIGVPPLARVAPNRYYEEKLLARAKLVFPGITWESVRQPWCGLRPLTPDGLPIMGAATAHSNNNIWLNVGHGSVGWTFAAGTGVLLARELLEADGLAKKQGGYVESITRRFGLESCAPLSNERFSFRAFFSPTRSSISGSSF